MAISEAEALAAVSRRRPDLITSDGMLDDGSGLAAVGAIRAESNIPVIFITGDAEAARSFAPDAVIIEKPFSGAALGSAIARSGFASLS